MVRGRHDVAHDSPARTRGGSRQVRLLCVDCCHADPEPLDPATDGDESTLFSPVVVRCCFLLLKLAEGALRIWLVAVAARRLIPATIAESDWTSKYSTASGCS